MYGGRPPAPTSSKRTDAMLAESVQQVLDAETTIDPGQIRSSVDGGWATLEGEVDSAAEQQQAGRSALEIEGIQGVTNRLRRSDTEGVGSH